MTREAAQAARLLGIELLDHVIIGQGRFVSLKDQRVL
jgi:DNA repair protein RadC